VSETNTGRFAASLASLKDLNGDGLSDVAVGAPLENEGEGVVYIYLGDRTHGINPEHVQVRVCFSSLNPKHCVCVQFNTESQMRQMFTDKQTDMAG